MRHLPMILALSAAAAFPAAASSYRLGALQADHPWISPPPSGAVTAAGYVVLSNRGRTPDRLLGGSTPAARRLDMHRTVDSGGIARMPAVKALPLAAGASVAFAPGGYHLMLNGLTAPLKPGQRVPVILQFEKAGPLKLEFSVERPGGAAATGTMDMHNMPGMHH